MKINKILLTGSSGFIGFELLKNLSKNYKVYITLRKKNKNQFKNKNIVEIYFNNYETLNKKLKKIRINTVIHCATHYVKYHNFNDLKKLNESNILFGNIILENLEKMNVKKFINFSTVWENYNGKKENYFNLYAAYKQSFNNLISFYKKIFKKTKFFNLKISDTFGQFDKRKKIINVLKINYKKNIVTNILSKNLFLNLLNVSDINNATKLILEQNLKPGAYVLKNKKDFCISTIIDDINNSSNKKIKINWLSKKVMKEKIYNYKNLTGWKPLKSKVKDISRLITG
jgi:nucleoside-diphosphate-sugar epimerase